MTWSPFWIGVLVGAGAVTLIVLVVGGILTWAGRTASEASD